MSANPTPTPSQPLNPSTFQPLDPYERVCAGASLLVATAATVALALAVCGCVYKGAKITEGTDLAMGLTVPGTEGMVQLNALNWLSGFRLGVAENAALTVEYTSVASNSYLGVVHTETAKRIKAKVQPCESDGNATGAATASASAVSCAQGASPASPATSEEGK